MHEVAIDWSTAVIETGPRGPVLEVSFTVPPDLAWFDHFHYEVVLDERRRCRNMREGRVRRDFSQVLQVGELDTKATDAGLLRRRYDRLVARTNKSQEQAWNRRQAAADKKTQFAADRVESEAAAPKGASVLRAEASRRPVTRGVVSVGLTRTQLVALRETIEVTPAFEGRTEVRDAIHEVLHRRQTGPPPLQVEQETLAALTERIIAIDVPTAALRSKLKRALNRDAVG